MWAYDDWSGGEGNRNYYADDPTVYNVGYELNPRIRGQLTARPHRRYFGTCATNDTSKRPSITIGPGSTVAADGGAGSGGGAGSAIWIGGGYRMSNSIGSPTSWTDVSAADVGLSALDAGYDITAMAGDHDYVYYAAWTSDASGTRVIMRMNKATHTGAIVVAEETGTNPFGGMCFMHGKLYAWTGSKLYEYDIDNTIPLAADAITMVYKAGPAPLNANIFSSSWWADCVATENSVIAFYTTAAISHVYEYKRGGTTGAGRPLYTAPYGFSIKAVAYLQGTVYFSGHWGGDSDAKGWGELYAMPLNSREPLFLGRFRHNQNNNLQMQEMCSSYGLQMMVAASHTGRIFVYDAELDSITMLDDLETTAAHGAADTDGLKFNDNDDRIGGMVTYGPYRVAVVYKPGDAADTSGNYRIVSYDDDEPAQRETGFATSDFSQLTGYLDSPTWDYDFPFENKALLGFHVTFEPLISGQSLVISYGLDGAAPTTALTTITSATAGSSTGRVFLAVAGTKFFRLQFRVKLISTTGVLAPILYGVAAEAKLTRKRLEWDIVIRVKDEAANGHPDSQKQFGYRIRDWLDSIVTSGVVVTMYDGYRYGDPGSSTSYSVTVQEAEDIIDRPGEGKMRLVLQEVPA